MRYWMVLAVLCLAVVNAAAARERMVRHRTHEGRASPAPAPPLRKDPRGDELPPGAISRLGSLRLRHPPLARGVGFQGAKTLWSAGAGLAAFAAPTGKPGRIAGRLDRELARVAISTDGKRAAVGQLSGTVAVVDLASGEEVGSEHSPGGPLAALAYPRAGQVALAAWQGGAVRWVDAKGAFTRDRFWLDAPVRAVALAADGKSLAASHGAGLLELRDARTGKRLRAFESPPPEVRALALSPDGARLACLTAEGLALLSTRTGLLESAIELDEEGHGPHQAAFAPDGRWVAVATQSGEVRLLDVASGETRAKLAAGSPGLALRRPSFAIQPGGGLVATAGLGVTVRLWDAKSGAEATPLPGHRHAVDQLAFAPGAGLVATAGPDGTVRLWNAATAEERQVMSARVAPAVGLGFLADGQLVAWSPVKDSLVLTDLASGTKLAVIEKVPMDPPPPPEPDGPPPFPMQPPASFTGPAASRPEPEPAFPGADLPLLRGIGRHLEVLWPDVLAVPAVTREAGQRVASALSGDPGSLAALGWAPRPDVRYRRPAPLAALSSPTGVIAIADGNAVRLHDARSGLLAKREELGVRLTALAFAPDGSALVAGGDDGTVSLLDVASGERGAKTLPAGDPRDVEIRAVAFGADGQTFAWVSAFGTVGVGRRSSSDLARWSGGQNGRAHDVALSSDGRWLATAGGDGVHVFEVVTRQEIAHLLGHRGDVLRVAFSPDSRMLASASTDGTVVIWDAQRFEQLIK